MKNQILDVRFNCDMKGYYISYLHRPRAQSNQTAERVENKGTHMLQTM